ncbi:MAG: diguanylate cyclase [Janthinobacterium lividum]
MLNVKQLLKEWSHISSRLTPRFLIVDDQPINIRVLHELFRDDAELFMAANGQQALDMAKDILPDMILLDIMMPEMNGYQACRHLKMDPMTADIPVIFITAQHSEKDEAIGFELGAVDFITKPFNSTIVKARVKIHLLLKLQSDILRSIAMLDGLTAVANRRMFNEVFDMHWRQSGRDGSSLSLIMLDIDYFKRYNDLYGHQAGDECLRRVAHAIKAGLARPSDLLARYGGEEFACVLPNTDAIGAMKVANSILAQIRSAAIEHKASDVASFVTASIGVATANAGSKPSAQQTSLLHAADQQLYAAKKAGRNKTSLIDLRG